MWFFECFSEDFNADFNRFIGFGNLILWMKIDQSCFADEDEEEVEKRVDRQN